MTRILPLSAALLLAVGLSQPSLGQGRGNEGENRGKGKGNPEARADRERDDRGGPGNGKGKGQDRRDRDDRDDNRREQARRGDEQAREDARRLDERLRDDARRRDEALREQAKRDDEIRREDGRRDGDRRHDRQDDQDRIIVVDRDDPRIVVFRSDRDRGLIGGCPPGLAKRNNGCVPPGQERQLDRALDRRALELDRQALALDLQARDLERARYDLLWDRRFNDDYAYRYDSGYLYRYDRQQNSLLGWLPVLAGALSVGNLWPQQYNYDPVPSYYSSYYGLNDPYDYRYAGGALYGVDRETSSIQSIAALLTGQTPQLGQRMPAGFDIYNVPYAWRDQYRDTADRNYRYNDGYVYQVDPTTQVVQAIIQLLT